MAEFKTRFQEHFPPAWAALIVGLASLVIVEISEGQGGNQLGDMVARSLGTAAVLLGTLTLIVGALARFRATWSGAVGAPGITNVAQWVALIGVVCGIVAWANVDENAMVNWGLEETTPVASLDDEATPAIPEGVAETIPEEAP